MFIHNQCLILVLVSSDLIKTLTDITYSPFSFFFTLLFLDRSALIQICCTYLLENILPREYVIFYLTILQDTFVYNILLI